MLLCTRASFSVSMHVNQFVSVSAVSIFMLLKKKKKKISVNFYVVYDSANDVGNRVGIILLV